MMLGSLFSGLAGSALKGAAKGFGGRTGSGKRRRRRHLTKTQMADIQTLSTTIGKTAAAEYLRFIR